MVCASIYGWTGANKRANEATRTNDILAIVKLQFDHLEDGPKMIIGDLNGSTSAFPVLQDMVLQNPHQMYTTEQIDLFDLFLLHLIQPQTQINIT